MLQNLFIFLLVNKAVLIVVGILQRVKTALLERSVTHFVKGEILIGVCSDLLFIYCADRLVTSRLNAVFLLVFWFMKMWIQLLRSHQGSRLWLSLITVSIDFMHFRIMQHTRLTRWAGQLWRTSIHSNKTVFSATHVLLLQNIDIVIYHIYKIRQLLHNFMSDNLPLVILFVVSVVRIFIRSRLFGCCCGAKTEAVPQYTQTL